jgi:tRNA 2-selenouridine synthase
MILPPARCLELMLEGASLIDVRAPVEFIGGSVPGSVNIPLLDDAQRAAIGICFKEQGQDAAIELGHQLISSEVRAQRLQAWSQFLSEHPQTMICCLRGGLRSRLTQKAILDELGILVPIVAGGYKALRQTFIETLERAPVDFNFRLVGGLTGSEKTYQLRKRAGELSQQNPRLHFWDLELFANHRGSAFGRTTSDQPTQANFENQAALDLLKLKLASPDTRELVVEDESQLIGKCLIPKTVFDKMKLAPLFVFESPRDARARHLVDIYLNENYGFQNRARSSETDDLFAKFYTDTLASLKAIGPRLGGLRTQVLLDSFELAFQAHAQTGIGTSHFGWVENLLEWYYDPLYARALERSVGRVLAKGDPANLALHI